MKSVIYYTNIVLGGLTLVGFLTIFAGLMGMMVVGGLHILSLLYYFTQWKSLQPSIRKHLQIYSIILVVLGVCGLAAMNENYDEAYIPLMIASFLAGIYFTFIIRQVYKAMPYAPESVLDENVLDRGLD